MKKILDLIRKIFKMQCKYCRHYYLPHRNECDINIGDWEKTSYCTCFEREVEK